MSATKRLIVAISGASGPIYGVRILEVLRDLPDIESHLILSPSAAQTISAETDFSLEHVRSLADEVHSFKDIGASISSGSYKTEGIIIAPCSIKTLTGVVNCFSDNLISRAADVCLKERRKVGLMVRETPLHQGHLELMVKAAQYGCMIIPPMPAFYHRPQTINDIVNQTVGRALDQFSIETDIVHRWKEQEAS